MSYIVYFVETALGFLEYLSSRHDHVYHFRVLHTSVRHLTACEHLPHQHTYKLKEFYVLHILYGYERF